MGQISQIPEKLRAIVLVNAVLFCVAAAISFPTIATAAPQDFDDDMIDSQPGSNSLYAIPFCSDELSVADQTHLDAAITAFNRRRTGCLFRINLTDDVYLNRSTPVINNNINKLLIKGNGFGIFGQNIPGVRPFEIETNTVVTMRQVSITGGNCLHIGNGGGILNRGKLTLIESDVSFNSAGRGGGIANFGDGISKRGVLILRDSTIGYNYAIRGGGIYNEDGATTLVRSTIARNVADWAGGGISNRSGILNIANSTISINECIADEGGGAIWNSGGTANLTNCTLSENEGICGRSIKNSDHATLDLSNTIIANSSVGGDVCVNFGSTVTAYCSLIELVSGSENDCITMDGIDGNIIGVDPKLGPLNHNGGLTETHRLLIGSPAINAGNNDLAVDPEGEPLTSDQRGSRRIFDYQVDMGAYEAVIRWVPAEPPSPPHD